MRFLSWNSFEVGEMACSKPGGKIGPSRDEELEEEDFLGLMRGMNLFDMMVGERLGSWI